MAAGANSGACARREERGGISAGEMVEMVFLLLGAGTEMTTRLIQRHYLAINRLKMAQRSDSTAFEKLAPCRLAWPRHAR
jgi:hypothetical protein